MKTAYEVLKGAIEHEEPNRYISDMVVMNIQGHAVRLHAKIHGQKIGSGLGSNGQMQHLTPGHDFGYFFRTCNGTVISSHCFSSQNGNIARKVALHALHSGLSLLNIIASVGFRLLPGSQNGAAATDDGSVAEFVKSVSAVFRIVVE